MKIIKLEVEKKFKLNETGARQTGVRPPLSIRFERRRSNNSYI